MLCERDTGFPLWKPTLYLASQVYLPGGEYNTQVGHLAAIHFSYVWSERNGIDLEKSFAEGKFLSLQQIENLDRDLRYDFRDYLATPVNFLFDFENPAAVAEQSQGYRRNRPRTIVKKTDPNKDGTRNIRLAHAKRYFEWLANDSISRVSAKDPAYLAMSKARDVMVKAIVARYPGKGWAKKRRGLTPEQRKRFIEVISPKSADNPFKSEFIKHRNHAICQVLLNTGPRRGEVLLIKKEDIEWNLGGAGATLDLHDHPLDTTDTRRVRPQFKTAERQLPLGRNLALIIKNYIQKYRDRIPGARSHSYLFVARDGSPLSLSSLDNIFAELAKLEGLPDKLTEHLIRYTWNDMFSELADQKITAGEWTVEDEKRTRLWHQGWADDSVMPQLYARRSIENKARKISLQMQEANVADMIRKD